MEKKKINIEKYVNDYENIQISVKDIAKQEKVSESTVYRELRVYYAKISSTRNELIQKYLKDYEEGNITRNCNITKGKCVYSTRKY